MNISRKKKYLLKNRILLFLCLFTLLWLPNLANGFKLFEWSVRGTGLAGAVIARGEGAASIFYNPAGMVNQEDSEIYLGGFYTSHQYHFFSPDIDLTVDSEKADFIIPSLALTHQIGKKLWLGFGIYSPSSYKINWGFDKRHPLVYLGRKMNMQVYHIFPSIGWKISERFSLGLNIGLSYSTIDYKIHYDKDFWIVSLTSGQVTDAKDFILSLDDCHKTSVAVNIGLQWKIVDRLTFGLSIYGDLGSRYKAGNVEFKEPDTPFPEVNEYLASQFKDSPEQNADFIFWDIPSIKAGLAWQISDSFSLEMAVYWNFWQVIDGRDIVFKPDIRWMDDSETEVNSLFKNTLSVRIGGEYSLSKAFRLRLGMFIDPSPAPTETFRSELPFTDQWGGTLGLGYKYKNFTFDLAYRLLVVSELNVSNDLLERWEVRNQEYAGRSEHLFSMGIGYRF